MTTRKTPRIALIFLALVLASFGLMGMKPFTTLPNTCPECPLNGYEQLIFADGKNLTVHILGDYPEFYLVERFGEFRIVAKSEVKSIDKSHAPTPNPDLNRLDLVLTSTPNEYVVAGRIEEVQPGRLIKIKPWKSSSESVTVWHKALKQIWRGSKLDYPPAGAPVASPVAAPPAAAPAALPAAK